jgi:hypothetical protein
MRLIVTITRADEVRRVKSRFSRPVILAGFSIQSVDSRHRLDVSIAQKPGVAGPLDEREYFDPERALKIGLMNGRKARESGLWLKACPSL